MILTSKDISIHHILSSKFSNRQYSYSDVEGLTIYDGGPTITQAQIDAAEVEVAQERVKNAYQDFRKKEYPLLGDLLDMLWHSMDAGEIPKSSAFYNAISAVKIKYPK